MFHVLWRLWASPYKNLDLISTTASFTCYQTLDKLQSSTVSQTKSVGSVVCRNIQLLVVKSFIPITLLTN